MQPLKFYVSPAIKAPIKRVVWHVQSVLLKDALSEWKTLETDVAIGQIHRLSSGVVRVDADADMAGLDQSWRMSAHQYPWSLTDEEGLVLYDVITSNGLKSGFEIATAFGYSSLYVGLALKRNDGTLTSMDCYVEEEKGTYHYEHKDIHAEAERVRGRIAAGQPPAGLAIARQNVNRLGLDKTIRFEIGVSPQDVPRFVGSDPIDFAYIDGGHFGDQPLQDFLAIAPNLASKCAVCFHDNNSPIIGQAVAEAERMLQARAITFRTRYRMTIVGRNLDLGRVQKLADVLRHRHFF